MLKSPLPTLTSQAAAEMPKTMSAAAATVRRQGD
jgi:hypothetical protein